jgi:glycosyltransferase involved in cell wall biosynthesis
VLLQIESLENEQMRVLRIAHASLTPALRQRERSIARLYPDVKLEVITTRRWREAEVEVDALPDDLFPVTMARTYLSKHIQLFAYDPRPIIKALRRHRPHLIDINHEPFSVACAELLTLCNWFAPQASIVLQTCQNIFKNYPPPFNLFERRALKRVDAIHVCSETVREMLRAKGFEKPIHLVPFGVNTEAFNFRPFPEPSSEPLTIGYVGRMLPGKGLNILAEALKMIAGESWKLLVIGDGPEREDFEHRLGAAALSERAKFTGAISFEQVPAHFQNLDVLVIPTETTARIREQFGRVIVEAMATGVPVIGSTCGAIPEVIADTGLVFPERNAGELANALRRMLTDHELRRGFARRGRPHVEQNYSYERVAEKTYELYQYLLGSKEKASLNPGFELAA